MTPGPSTVRAGIGRPHARFATVLALLLTLLFWVVGPGVGRDARLALDLTAGAILLIALLAATDDARHRRRAIAFGVLAAALNGTTLAGFRPGGLGIGPVMSLLFCGYTTVLLLGRVLQSRRVTGDVLAGALAAYILAGLSFALAYGVVEARSPGAFANAGGRTAGFPDLVYFSFVTLLTIGFGDVTPTVPLARALAVFEGLFGVVYTTIVMASLLAAYVESRREQDGGEA